MPGDRLLDLPLFSGPHIPTIRFERALQALDFKRAAADARPEWRTAVEDLAAEIERAGDPVCVEPEALAGLRRVGWPEALERAWQSLMGLVLDGPRAPGTHDGELAAAYLLRGGRNERARRSLDRHLAHDPRDVRAWELLARFEPVRAAARCGFHGGPPLDAAGDLIDLAGEDGVEPAARWLLVYAWLARRIDLEEIRRALEAEKLDPSPPPVPNDARAFAWYVVAAGTRRYTGSSSTEVVEARACLQRISATTFKRYLLRL